MSNVTIIDAKRGLRPRAAAGDAEVAARLAALQEKAKGRDAHGILQLALVEEFAGGVVVADCELSAGDAVVLGRYVNERNARLRLCAAQIADLDLHGLGRG